MDFFEQQEQAHRQSKKLLFLFLLAVIAIVLSVNFSLALIWQWAYASHGTHASIGGTDSIYPRFFFLTNTVLTLLFIGGGTMLEMFRLRDGGDAVAQMAGGRLIPPGSGDAQERRLLNIVEEMAIASGIACPRVYIMDREDAINAFAAGYHQNEAVVAVTRGTLLRLNRDELQGVIGHEFSHILNGDMRMNVKLIGVLFGIQMIAGFGQELMYWGSRFGSSRSRDDKGPPLQLVLLAVGAALFAIGYIGIFFGRLIKSAVSRQREFLADASAVQFIRNADGIGGALRKIGGLTRSNDCGSRIDSPHAEQLSHMFLGAARPHLLSGFFATHPPLEERLRRIFGRRVEMLDASEIAETVQPDLPQGTYGFGARNVIAAQAQRGLDGNAEASVNAFAGSAPEAVGGWGLLPKEAAEPAETVAIEPIAGTSNTAFGAHASLHGGSIPASATALPVAKENRIDPAIMSAARDPYGARALVYALLLDRSDPQGYEAQLAILKQAAPTQSASAVYLCDLLAQATSTATTSSASSAATETAKPAETASTTASTTASFSRITLLDLSMPALKSLALEQKTAVLSIVHRLIAADQRMTQAEFVLQTVLERRLGAQSGRAVPVRFARLAELRYETALLIALMARTAANGDETALQASVQQALTNQPSLLLTADDILSRRAEDFFEVKQALDKLNQLAPLAKPFLIKLLLATANGKINAETGDLLRGVCAAIDAPMPELMMAA